MAEIYPHIEVALSQADREHQEALSTLTALQTQLSLNQTKIRALVAELQATHQQVEHYARTIPQVERVRLRTDQKLRQLREHADRVSKDLAAERRVQGYLEELQADDENGERRLKEYVSEVMRKDAEGYGDSDSESEWSVLDRSVDSLKASSIAPVASGTSTPIHGGQRSLGGPGIPASSNASSRHSSPPTSPTRNNALAASDSSVRHPSGSVEGTSSDSWISGGNVTTTSISASSSIPELAQAPLQEPSGPATPLDQTRNQNQGDGQEEPTSVDEPSDSEEEDALEPPHAIEQAYPPLCPVKRGQGQTQTQEVINETHVPMHVPAPAPSQSTPRPETSALATSPDVPQEMTCGPEEDGYGGEEDCEAVDNDEDGDDEDEAEESVKHSPEEYMTPSSGTMDRPLPSPPILEPTQATYEASPVRCESQALSQATPTQLVQAQDALGLQYESPSQQPQEQHQEQSLSNLQSPPRSRSFLPSRAYHYPPSSARSALIAAPQAYSSSSSSPMTPSHESYSPDLPPPGAQNQNQKYIWSPLPPSGTPEPGLIGSPSRRHNAASPVGHSSARRAEMTETEVTQLLSYREYIPSRSVQPSRYSSSERHPSASRSPGPISRRSMVRPTLS
ncbi:hypothetical protein FRB96_003609 [Tulasnella sp. 330]|nr:hypothetical protein FRB96_003609 [Tulasnella sp. 330]